MIEILRCLKNEYGVIEIKSEFEGEGSRIEELMRLKDITSKVDLPIIIKIGGVEAVTDIYNALAIGVKSIIAPMAETPYALSKFINIIDTIIPEDNAKDIEFAFNMETVTGYNNLKDMLKLPKFDLIQGMTIGRVDLCGSLGYDRAKIEFEEIFNICVTSFRMAKKKGLHCGLGGAISSNTIDTINRLNKENLIDKYETRKVVFSPISVKYGEKGILKAIEFELSWLKSKRRYYSGIKSEDENRIAMLEKRFNS